LRNNDCITLRHKDTLLNLTETNENHVGAPALK